MSTQTKFDLDGLSQAIGARDARYQLALFADRAEVEILDRDDPARPLQVLRGKAEIREWLAGMSTGAVRSEVTGAEARPHEVRFTEECWYPDGTDVRYECQAEVYRGQIVHAWLTLGCRPVPEDDPAATTTARPDIREDRIGPTDARSLPPRAAPALNRSLPGNFLG